MASYLDFIAIVLQTSLRESLHIPGRVFFVVLAAHKPAAGACFESCRALSNSLRCGVCIDHRAGTSPPLEYNNYIVDDEIVEVIRCAYLG